MFGFINIDRDTNDLFRIRVIWAFERFPGKLKTLTVSIKNIYHFILKKIVILEIF